METNFTFALITQPLNHTTINGVSWLLPLAVIVITLLLITKSTTKWKLLLLPVCAGWGAVGLRINLIIYILAAILFAMETIFGELISSTLEAGVSYTRDKIQEKWGGTGVTPYQRRRYREQQEELKIAQRIANTQYTNLKGKKFEGMAAILGEQKDINTKYPVEKKKFGDLEMYGTQNELREGSQIRKSTANAGTQRYWQNFMRESTTKVLPIKANPPLKRDLHIPKLQVNAGQGWQNVKTKLDRQYDEYKQKPKKPKRKYSHIRDF